MDIDISVIVPIYRTEKYIERCLHSLFTQTKTRRVEYILINDATTDTSMEVVKSVIAQYSYLNISTIQNIENKGIGYTRKRGIEVAKGEYTIQIDSDDYCTPSMLEELYAKAKESNADIVGCDYYYDYGSSKKYMAEPLPNNTNELWELFFYNGWFHALWNKLVRRKLYLQNENFFISEINNGEDFLASCKLFHYAQKWTYIPKAFIYYNRLNYDSLTKQNVSKIKVIERFNAVKNVEKFLIMQNYSDFMLDYLNEYKLYSKIAVLLNTKGEEQRKYINEWKELNNFVYKSNFHFHRKIIFWLLTHHCVHIANLMIKLNRFKRWIFQ